MEKITRALQRTYWNRAATPVIVQASPNRLPELTELLRQRVPVNLLEAVPPLFPRILGAGTVPLSKWKELPAFNMVATVLTPALIEEVAGWAQVEKVYPDAYRYPVSYPVVPREGVYVDYKHQPFTSTRWVKTLLGLDKASAAGWNGSGVKVAVLDTGCEKALPQVTHVHIHTAMPEKGGLGTDANGHGTWCSSCVGGRSWTDRRYNVPVEGMAVEAELHSVQVLGFIVGMGMESDILQGMEIALRLGAKVVSMSLGGEDAPPDSENAEAVAVNNLSEKGVIVVVAAGNSGPETRTIGSPGCCLNSLTVGALDPVKGVVADFSSRGPTAGDDYVKPDVVSYGVRVHSQIAGFLATMTDPTDRIYAPLSGTSMATPAAAGLVACMAQVYKDRLNRDLTVNEVKRMMDALGHMKTNEDGWGLLHWGLVEDWVSQL